MPFVSAKTPAAVGRNRSLVTSVAIALSLVSLFFLLQVAPHAHSNGQEDPACRLCQVAHIGVAPVVTAALLSVVLLYFGEIQLAESLHFIEAFFAHSSSRAPPASLA